VLPLGAGADGDPHRADLRDGAAAVGGEPVLPGREVHRRGVPDVRDLLHAGVLRRRHVRQVGAAAAGEPGGAGAGGSGRRDRRAPVARPILDPVRGQLGGGPAPGRAGHLPAPGTQVRGERVAKMADVVLEAMGLSKKFKKGESHRSLRDFIPALAKSVAKGTLSKEEFWALKDVTFQVERGEAFGVIGHNGAGKSTMLKHLCGILFPTSGELRVKGRLSALIEVGAGFHPDLTGRENIYLNGTILGMSRAEIDKKFDAIVAFSELEDFLDTPVKRFSSGMYARLGFAVAAHVDPDVLIVDEVLSVGDFLFQRKSVEKMRQVMKSGTTVVFVSHNLRAIADLCPRSMLLEHGRVAAIGASGTVIKTYMERGAADTTPDESKDAY